VKALYQHTSHEFSIAPDKRARIEAAVAQLQQEQRKLEEHQQEGTRRGQTDAEILLQKTNSVFTPQPVVMSKASPAAPARPECKSHGELVPKDYLPQEVPDRETVGSAQG
jgi:hypothetical protein